MPEESCVQGNSHNKKPTKEKKLFGYQAPVTITFTQPTRTEYNPPPDSKPTPDLIHALH